MQILKEKDSYRARYQELHDRLSYSNVPMYFESNAGTTHTHMVPRSRQLPVDWTFTHSATQFSGTTYNIIFLRLKDGTKCKILRLYINISNINAELLMKREARRALRQECYVKATCRYGTRT